MQARFSSLLVLSLALATTLYFELFDPIYEWLEPRVGLSFIAALLYIFLLPLLWVALLALGVWRHGMRALWMLPGAPLALYRPFMFVLNPDFP
jgi:hypothetical protein